MAYTTINFKTKKALRESVESGRKIGLSAWPPFQRSGKNYDTVTVEGPHYPMPHKWYATVTLDEDGYITKVR